MKMSHAYMKETIDVLKTQDYVVTTSVDQMAPSVLRSRYVLAPEDVQFTLECVERSEDEDYPESYYLEWNALGPVTSTSFELDSWKHRADRVEFKYQTDVTTGRGLALVLHFPPAPGTDEKK